jgi:flagellar hook protein FlgE
MGIYGALTTSVAGLSAQAFALQNISGNIANSQTTAYKAVNTNFSDIVTSVGSTVQESNAGSVRAVSSPTNTVQGSVNSTGVATNMAINGQGYFQVQQLVGETDGSETFSGTNVYTRTGDFSMDKQGYLVNGSGAALMAIPIDPATGNPVGDTAQLLQISTGYLKANPTSTITYQANLPASPSVGLINRNAYTTDPTPVGTAASSAVQATTTGTAYTPIDTTASASGYSFNIGDGTNTANVTMSGNGPVSGSTTWTAADVASAINTAAAAASPAVGISASVSGSDLVLTSTAASTSTSTPTVSISNIPTAIASDLGFGTSGTTAMGTPAYAAGTGVIAAQDNSTFQSQSLAGSSTTAYTSDGTAVNVQMRWAETANSPPTWSLYYQSNASATGSQAMWTNTGTSVVFNSNGALVTPSDGKISVPNMTVNGTNLGNISMNFGTTGLTQYDSATGVVDVSTLNQNGYTSGSLTTVSVNSQGQVVASYSNGQQVPIAQVPLYKFNNPASLNLQSGGIYTPTDDSGAAVKMTSTDITGGALEASNTDIATQFSQMIVTQQAYSANSKIITTANTMMQDVMDIIR